MVTKSSRTDTCSHALSHLRAHSCHILGHDYSKVSNASLVTTLGVGCPLPRERHTQTTAFTRVGWGKCHQNAHRSWVDVQDEANRQASSHRQRTWFMRGMASSSPHPSMEHGHRASRKQSKNLSKNLSNDLQHVIFTNPDVAVLTLWMRR